MNLSFGRSDKGTSQHHPRAERRVAPDLAAFHFHGSIPYPATVKNISSTGAYLLTEERWDPGSIVSLSLQRSGPFEKSPQQRFGVQARAVRWGEDGVAVSFVLPEGADLRLWQSPLKSAAEQTAPEDILREFRIAHAIAFLSRLAPAVSREIRQLLHEGLSNIRLEMAIDVILTAEKMLESKPEADKMHAFPQIVVRVVEDSSWSDDDVVKRFWAGLLVSSCTPLGEDESNLCFLDMMSQLSSIHARLLAGACTRAPKMISGPGRVTSRAIACSASDLMKISGSHDLIRIDRDLDHMAELGLIGPREKSSFFSPISDAKITPTSLGLELFARCNGHRGTPQGFYGLTPAATPPITNSELTNPQAVKSN
jgi:hypothetical protein